jgi:hypothetical protein
MDQQQDVLNVAIRDAIQHRGDMEEVLTKLRYGLQSTDDLWRHAALWLGLTSAQLNGLMGKLADARTDAARHVADAGEAFRAERRVLARIKEIADENARRARA